jgi:hypothetical protein
MAAGGDDAEARNGDPRWQWSPAGKDSTVHPELDFAAHADEVRLLRLRPPQAESRVSLVVCSLCLSVWRDSSWVPPEDVIRELRTYELADLPPLDWAVCDHCTQAISLRRGQTDVPSAA